MAVKILVAILAVYRLSRMIIGERGPFSIFENIRAVLDSRFPPDENGIMHWVNEGYNCALCVSFWLSLPAAVWMGGLTVDALFYWLGIAGGAVIIYRNWE